MEFSFQDRPTQFNSECFMCCCRVCTHRLCPYRKGWDEFHQYRCRDCFIGSCSRPALDCDFFENRHLVGRRFKVKRMPRVQGEIEKRLDAIMQAVGAQFSEDKKGTGR